MHVSIVATFMIPALSDFFAPKQTSPRLAEYPLSLRCRKQQSAGSALGITLAPANTVKIASPILIY
jgi:hypothetical protein